MKKIFFQIFVLISFAQVAIACDATLSPDKSYAVITLSPVKKLEFENEKILSGQVMSSIFGEKNQLILNPLKIGKTKMTLNDRVYSIEISREQKEEWNIQEAEQEEIDTPFDTIFNGDEKRGNNQ